MGWQWLVLLLFTSLTTYRVTRLVVKDDFPLIAVPRRWVVGVPHHHYDHDIDEWVPERRHEGRWWYWFGELISCHWCASGWVSLAVTIAVASSNKEGTLVEWFLLWMAQWALGAVTADKAG